MTVNSKRIPFGKPMLKAFCMDPEYTNLNARQLLVTPCAPSISI
jgi:hypothetical protein